MTGLSDPGPAASPAKRLLHQDVSNAGITSVLVGRKRASDLWGELLRVSPVFQRVISWQVKFSLPWDSGRVVEYADHGVGGFEDGPGAVQWSIIDGPEGSACLVSTFQGDEETIGWLVHHIDMPWDNVARDWERVSIDRAYAGNRTLETVFASADVVPVWNLPGLEQLAAPGSSGGGGGHANSPAHQAAPASWHPDPTGRHQLRYWDGSRWTDHVADNGVQSTSPL